MAIDGSGETGGSGHLGVFNPAQSSGKTSYTTVLTRPQSTNRGHAGSPDDPKAELGGPSFRKKASRTSGQKADRIENGSHQFEAAEAGQSTDVSPKDQDHDEVLVSLLSGPQGEAESKVPESRPHFSDEPSFKRAGLVPTAPDPDWKKWPELTIRLGNIPYSTLPLDLYRTLEKHGGKIIFAEVLEDGKGYCRIGRVRFSPPPAKAFWEKSFIWMRSAGQNCKVLIEVEPPKRMMDSTVRSPINARLWYSRITKLSPISLDFGVMLGDATMLRMKSIEREFIPEKDGGLQLTVDLLRKRIVASFGVKFATRPTQFYKFVLDFHQLKKIHWRKAGPTAWQLTIPLDYPPHYFWKRTNVEETFAKNATVWTEGCLWYRVTDIATDAGGIMFRQLSPYDSQEITDPAFIHLGRWTTFRFILEECTELTTVLQALGDFNVNIDSETEIKVDSRLSPPFWTLANLEPEMRRDLADKSETLAKIIETSSTILDKMPFEIRYQLDVCISRGALSEYAIDLEFLEKLGSLDPKEARRILEYVADNEERISDPMSIFEMDEDTPFRMEALSLRVPHYCVVTRKVMVTPTGVYFTSPGLEIANRVLRKYRSLQDRFIRVQFTGELYEGRIYPRSESEQDDEMYKRVLRVLTRGIRIGARHYEFLAFGNSQIRENGAYFFAGTDEVSCDSIRESMGDFSRIKTVAKYAARMGQCFSTTREIRTISIPKIRHVNDITNKAGYCFTDGVGKISQFLAKMIVQELGMGCLEIIPSAFQFRMGGCKGVLAVWPDAKKREVHIRESQFKFPSKFNGLEIIRCAQFAVATLNRQTITILSSLGVKTEAFLTLLNIHVDKHNNAQLSSRDAITLLRQQVDENQTTLTLADIILHGFKEPSVQEPFIVTVLNLWRVWSLKLVKERARIPVEKSAFVLGCVDETGTLRGHKKSTEGSTRQGRDLLPQIFLQITDSEDQRNATVVTGICIIGRNPSLHPGDIRVVEAVDVPALRHLRDVVVFPSVGDRDLPSMLSGGDLDGDDFFVIWEPSLIPPEWNYPPMDYQSPKPKELDNDVHVAHLQQFFVRYMKNDILPTVALAHLAHADSFDDGAKNAKCKFPLLVRNE